MLNYHKMINLTNTKLQKIVFFSLLVSQIRMRHQLGREAIPRHTDRDRTQKFTFHRSLAGILQGQLPCGQMVQFI